MSITVETAAKHLLDSGLITPEPILNGTFSISVLPRRNRNLIVRFGDDSGFVIKQSEPARPGGTAGSLKSEAKFYGLIRANAQAAMSDIVPSFVYYDGTRTVLVLEYLSHHETLAQHCLDLASERFPIALWRELGGVLARVHDTSLPTDDSEGKSPSSIPWPFAAHQPPLESLRTLSSAGLMMLRVVQTSPVIRKATASAVSSWEASALMHGDLRLDNVMYKPNNDFRLIDWELWGFGDPMWDVACVVSDIVSLWLQAAIPDAARHDDDIDDASWPVFQAAIRSFWYGYSASPKQRRMQHEKVASYAALRLIQTAFESCVANNELPRISVLMLQVSENILSNPRKAADEFLAITVPDLAAER